MSEHNNYAQTPQGRLAYNPMMNDEEYRFWEAKAEQLEHINGYHRAVKIAWRLAGYALLGVIAFYGLAFILFMNGVRF